MQIKKFKLLDEGFTGVEISGSMLKNKGTLNVLTEFSGMKYKVPVPRDIVSLVQGLKYALLKMTSIMPDEAEEFFDFEYDLPKLKDYQKQYNKDLYAHTQALIQNVFVTGFFYDGESMIITGKMLGYEQLTYSLNTPKVKFDLIKMEFEVATEMLVGQIIKAIKGFINSIEFRKMESKQYLLDLWKGDEDKLAEVRGMSDKEAEEAQIEQLKAKGFIVVDPEEVMDDIRITEAEIEQEVPLGIKEDIVEEEIIPKAIPILEPEETNVKPPYVRGSGFEIPAVESGIPVPDGYIRPSKPKEKAKEMPLPASV